MPVTEFCFLHLSSPFTPETHQTLEEAQCIQDKWALEQDPNTPLNRIARGTGMLQQIGDPTALLITAPWESPAAHWEWIGTDANKEAMRKLTPLIVTEGDKKLVLFHVDAILFPRPDDDVTSPLASAVLGVHRYRVKSSEREAFESRVVEALATLATGPGTPFGWGWRIEKGNDDTEDLLMVRGWDSEEQRAGFIGSDEYVVLEELASHTLDFDIYSYRRIV
ncbi:uncharacterized protein DNG_02022 [Cephalotrichum gorgonifer]|uniref:ABM domain-containing protein n=1 Tax=Cephalotrichum gorgonifer TaxID=2041049 RepID=A0AAE8SS69_9PEZI|nr:uncharacterized protein DNG_02022 [Cephalotrichum gorgonifer]